MPLRLCKFIGRQLRIQQTAIHIKHPKIVRSIHQSSRVKDDDVLQRIKATKHWLTTIVIGRKLCPFAPPFIVKKKTGTDGVINTNKLRICVSQSLTDKDIISDIANEAHLLVGDDSTKSISKRPETTLVILNENNCPSLKDYSSFVQLSWKIQSQAILKNGHVDKVQIVLFHPFATHSTYSSEENDAADYTIRSPYPTIHLLRQADVLHGVKSYNNLESLPFRNKTTLRKDGLQVCQARLENCKTV